MRFFYIILLLLPGIVVPDIQSQNNHYISFTDSIISTNYTKTLPDRYVIHSDVKYIELEYQFRGGLISKKSVNGIMYDFLHIDGFAKMGQVGAPALPAHNEIIALPTKAGSNIVIIESEYKEYKGLMIHPALEPATDTEGDPEPTFFIDPLIYNSNEFFPKKIVEITHTLLSRGVHLAVSQIRPVQFNPVSGIIRVYSRIKYRVEFIGGEKSFTSYSNNNSLHYTNLLKRNVINSAILPDGMTSNHKSASSDAKNYIIITHSQYLNAANDLANWKRQLGLSVEVVSGSSWTAAQVKDSIHSRFQNWTPHPDYFVIIGDHDGPYAVPGEIHSAPTAELFATDLYYACMDGTEDWVPDMAHGRISVSSNTEAHIIVDKIINYEKNPVNDASFYQNGVNCAQYQDDNNDGYADRRFCHTNEEIRDYLQNNYGYSCERVYYSNTSASISTLRYDNSLYSNGELLAPELRDTAFNWSGGNSNITTAINNGKFFVFHRDHGYTGGSGWHRPYYTTSSMTSLTNGDKLPVIFSINCHTGEYQLSNCFAEKIMRMENKGAVGVIATVYTSYSGYNDALSTGLIDAIWSDPGLFPVFGYLGSGTNYTIGPGNDIHSMGDVVNQGLFAMMQNCLGSTTILKYQNELFHWFGDPAMKIWTSNPNNNLIAANHALSLSSSGSNFTIANSVVGATASLVHNNELIGITVLDSSGNGTIFYSIPNPDTTATLTISKHNHKPYETTLNLDVVPQDRIVQNVTIGANEDTCYDATQTIIVAGNGTSFNLNNGGSTEFVAGSSIKFKVGVKVYPGAYLHGIISPGGPYCPTQPQNKFVASKPNAEKEKAKEYSPDIYPNPCTGKFYFELQHDIKPLPFEVVIYDFTGKPVVKENIHQLKTQMNLSMYPAGVYFIRVDHALSPKIYKVIKVDY